jgi:hypothetical protein
LGLEAVSSEKSLQKGKKEKQECKGSETGTWALDNIDIWQIVDQEGVFGLYRGLSVALLANFISNAIYFG